MVLAARRLDQSINDSDEDDEQQFAEVLERMRHCSTSNCELFASTVKQSIASGLSTSSTDTSAIWWQLTASATQLPHTLSATARSVNGHLTTQIGVNRLPTELPVGSTTRLTNIASIAAAAAASVAMSPALVMIDRFFRPAFNSTAPSALEPSTIVHQSHHQYETSTPLTVNLSYPTRDSGGCIAFPSSISSSSVTATAAPETSRLSTPILLRPAVVASSNLLPMTGVSSPVYSTQAGLPLHDALSRFRVYRRSGFPPSAASFSTPLNGSRTTNDGHSKVTVCSRIKICGPAAPTGAMTSRVCIRQDMLSPLNAPDDEVRDLLETGSLMSADDDDLGVADIRQKVYRWTVTKAKKETMSSDDSSVSKIGNRNSEISREANVADDVMAVDAMTELGRRDDVISDVDVDTDDDEEWIDDPVDTPLPQDQRDHCEPALTADKIISPGGIASLQTIVQRPSLDFDKMQRTCFRRQRVQHGAVRKPRVITLKNSGWLSPDLKRSSAAFNPAVFSFRSLSAVKSSMSRHCSADSGNTCSIARGMTSPASP